MYRILVSGVDFRRSTRNFQPVKMTHERFFLRVKTGYFRIFILQNLGLRVKRKPCFTQLNKGYTHQCTATPVQKLSLCHFCYQIYCETRNFRRALIFVEFVGNAIHEFKFTTNVRSRSLICDWIEIVAS